MSKTDLAKEIYNISHITGKFLLRSGQVSSEYFDKYLFESDPVMLNEIGIYLSEIIPAGTQIFAGLEMGGIPLAAVLSLNTGTPSIFVRKTAKEYGTRKLAEGINFHDKNVCIIEDVVTTGGQIIKSAGQLRGLGAKIEYVMCVIVRDPKAFENLSDAGLKLLPLFTMEELKKSVQ